MSWRTIGMVYGYPLCCIEAFCAGEQFLDGPRKLKGTGFIPCRQCNATKTESQLCAEISARRLTAIPFPFGNGVMILFPARGDSVVPVDPPHADGPEQEQTEHDA